MMKWRENLVGYTFILPSFLILSTFTLFPVIYSIGISFFSWDMISPSPKFVGLDNYLRLFRGDELFNTLWRTFFYTLITVPPSMFLGLVFALLLDRKLKSVLIYRTVFFAPLVTSTVAIAAVWMFVYHADYGLINKILKEWGLPTFRWLNDASTSLIALAIMAIWKNTGFCVIVYLAGLQNISHDIIEAAQMDGAHHLRIIQAIKFPLLTPTTYVLTILMTIEQFQTFTQVHVMTQGGPAQSTQLIVIMLWKYAFEYFQMGYASAIAVVILVIILIITLLQMFFLDKRVHYQ